MLLGRFGKFLLKQQNLHQLQQLQATNNKPITIKMQSTDSSDKCEENLTESIRESTSTTSTSSRLQRRRLAAFDFDYTIVAKNTDAVVRDLLLPDKLPKDLSNLIETQGWTQYMAAVFRLLHEHKFTADQIFDTINAIPEMPGFVRLIKRLRHQYDYDLIIISDSNSAFIAKWLETHALTDCFVGVFTNPAHFQENGLLCIKPYHHQTDCRLSATNLCKGKVLEHFIVEQDLRHNIRYERVIYVGDGNNDICPVLRLRKIDIACARRGYAMEKNLAKNKDKMPLRAQLLLWNTGFDLLEMLEAEFRDETIKQQKT